ncbi:MAG: hypothetical protein MR627_07390 [Prevotella sp.]|nr:hypothetical protein [Prevotella sp.]
MKKYIRPISLVIEMTSGQMITASGKETINVSPSEEPQDGNWVADSKIFYWFENDNDGEEESEMSDRL